ncbi:putative membrane protein [Motilibacter rhizosphaerae]|uniref:Putative membrane protein n=1 Tax=Motilibacter rhizosphaerae TaxID=598652 RepID=A0A4Q7NSH3_9ACTN|nr:anthrone oxygenase family protein [Motilibacter rhizosphaerae]RZS90083.1 putative membrane protein [Motilibacter rhizosphaerae]
MSGRRTTLTAAVGAGLNGGVFFAFSAFVMPALDRLPDAAATEAMRSINVTAVTAPFMTALFGTAALTLVTAWQGFRARGTRAGRLLLGGSGAYLVGVIGTTMVANVPMNDRLAAGTLDWADYSGPWTACNTVRAATGIAAAALLCAAAVADRVPREACAPATAPRPAVAG